MSSNTTEWGSNDYSNLITITASAIASVLLVVFKSRCKKINICFGLLSCDRVVQSESEDDEEEQKKLTKTKSKSTKEASPEPEDLY